MNKGFIIPNIQFPIILITPDGTKTYYLSEEPITKININVFEKRVLHDSIFIDANAIKYKVQSVENLGYTNRLGGLNIFLERNIYVKVELEKIKEFDLEEFKSFISEIITENSDYYISADIDTETLKRKVAEAEEKSKILSIII